MERADLQQHRVPCHGPPVCGHGEHRSGCEAFVQDYTLEAGTVLRDQDVVLLSSPA